MKFFTTSIGRLRILALIEGGSLLALILIGLPLKYGFDYPELTEFLGPIHGGLFLLFILNSFSVGISENWKFYQTTWKVVLASLIPFGTFYIDHKVLRPIFQRNGNELRQTKSGSIEG